MFGIFKTKKIKGKIGFLGLEDWWSNVLNDYDKNEILLNYSVFGTKCIEKGDVKGIKKVLLEDNIDSSNLTILKFLNGIISLRKLEAEDSLLIKIADLVEEQSKKDDINMFDLHLAYGQLGKEYYTLRKDENCYNKAKYYFLKQIEISEDAKKSWIEEDRKLGIEREDSIIPSHLGYKQMAIIYDKEKCYDKAIELCNRAIREEWSGDWDKRILRLEKKVMKK